MPPLTIVCDLPLPARIRRLIRKGASPHKCLFVRNPSSAALRQADIALGQPALDLVLEAPRLRWVHVTSAGYTRYDTPEFRRAAKAKGLALTNSSSVFAPACAQHVLAFILAQTRQLPLALRPDSAEKINDAKIVDGLADLHRQRVAIVGYGAIAQKLIGMLAPFDVEIIAVRRRPTGREEVRVVRIKQVASALRDADHVIDLLPDNADSRAFFNAARFRAMKRGASFYNIGRGATVDQKALAAALRSGRLGAAWLDVTTPEPLPARHELRKFPNCHVTPHLAGNHPTWADEMARLFLENLARFRAKKPLLDQVI